MRLLKVLLASLFVSSAAVAGEVNGLHYGSISLAYSHQTDKFTDDGEVIKSEPFKGPVVNAETLVADRVLLGLTYGQVESSNSSVDGVARTPAVKTKASPTVALIGYRFEAGKGVDVIPFVEHRSYKVKQSGGRTSEGTFDFTAVGVQLRAALSTQIELHLTIDRDDDKTNGIGSRALYKVNKNWATFLGYTRQSGTSSSRTGNTIVGVSYLF